MTETLRRNNQRHPPGTATGVYGRRRRRLLSLAAVALAVVTVFTGTALGHSLLLQPKLYGAQADVLITPRPDISDAAVDRAMLTQVMIVTSDPVLQPVADRAGVPVSRLRGNVSAEMVGRTNLLRLTVSDGNEARAVELVRLLTAEYLARSTAAPGAPARPDDDPPTRSTILSPAAPLDSPLQPRPLRAVAAGLLLGLLAAAIAVVALERPRWLTRPFASWL
jgi:capsular polysaccharide biosynthesis protein